MDKLKLSLVIVLSTVLVAAPCYAQSGVTPTGGEVTGEAITVTEEIPTSGGEDAYVKPGHVTLNFKDADIKSVLNYLSEVSGVDIVTSPDVAGTVTLKLTDKPWETALDIITKNYGYAYEREGNIIRVVTVSSLKMEELTTEVVLLNYASAEEVQETIKDMLTDRGKLTYDSRTNMLVVTDLPTNVYKIKKVVEKLDRKTPQVMIEAKIIETGLDDEERLGIDWNIIIRASGASRPTTIPFWDHDGGLGLPTFLVNKIFPSDQATQQRTTNDAGGTTITDTENDFPMGQTRPFPFAQMDDFTYGTLDFSQFSAVLEYLNRRQDTDIISNPRITTLNNKSAKMFVGKVYNYISEIEQKEDSGGQERWTYEIEKEEIGIRLLVTPHVNDTGDIEVELKPEIKDVIGWQQITEFFSLPIFTTREAETQVMVRDMDTIFIGGLIREKIIQSDKKFPILGDLIGDVPFVGSAFKHKTETKVKTELIFFLTVHIVKNMQELRKFATRDLTEIEVPLETLEWGKATVDGKEVLAAPGSGAKKKEHKPFFDFGKKK